MEALETATHISNCSGCAEEESKSRKVLDALRSMGSIEAPGNIASGVVASLRRLRNSLDKPVGGRAALKWGALSIAALCATLHFSTDFSPPALGLRMITRLGEMLQLDSLIQRIFTIAGKFIPSSTGAVLSFFREVSVPSDAGTLASPVLLSLMLVAGASFALLLSLASLGGIAWNRARYASRRGSRGF